MDTKNTQFLHAPWREELKSIASAARQSFIVVAPFIKEDAAEWLCSLLRPDVSLLTLACLDVRAVSASALDLSALRRLAAVSPASRLFSVPSLHAKVYIADDQAAIVTSGNLTASALDRNREYGALFREESAVREIRTHMVALTRIGNPIEVEVIESLIPVEAELRLAETERANSVRPDAQRRFSEVTRDARHALIATQVGSRSANAVFGEAIRFALADGPQPTRAIAERVRLLMPDLCDDSEELIIKGEHYGKRWKHRLRNAQQHLKSSGLLTYDRSSRLWTLVQWAEDI